MVSCSPWWWMPVAAPGSTRKVPPQRLEVMCWSAEMAERRWEPGVWSVPALNWAGVVMVTVDMGEGRVLDEWGCMGSEGQGKRG